MPPGQAMVVVDAGYLIKALVLGARRRSREHLDVDWSGLTAELARTAAAETGLPLLRQTWYDASWFAQPREEHRALAALPGVHVRLGWLVRTERGLAQKAVDSQIVRDLVVVALERAVDQVVIVAGDGDLVPGVHELVDRGVRVHIWDVDLVDPRVRQSQELIALADQRLSLDLDRLGAHVRVLERPEPAPGAAPEPGTGTQPGPAATAPSGGEDDLDVGGRLPAVADELAPSGADPPEPQGDPSRSPGGPGTDVRLGPPPLRQLDPDGLTHLLPTTADTVTAEQFGALYGSRWASEAGPELLHRFFEIARRPGLPRLIDHDLLRSARENELGLDDEGVRHQLREGFWQALDTAPERSPSS